MVALAALMYWARLEISSQSWTSKFGYHIGTSRELVFGGHCRSVAWPPGIGRLQW